MENLAHAFTVLRFLDGKWHGTTLEEVVDGTGLTRDMASATLTQLTNDGRAISAELADETRYLLTAEGWRGIREAEKLQNDPEGQAKAAAALVRLKVGGEAADIGTRVLLELGRRHFENTNSGYITTLELSAVLDVTFANLQPIIQWLCRGGFITHARDPHVKAGSFDQCAASSHTFRILHVAPLQWRNEE